MTRSRKCAPAFAVLLAALVTACAPRLPPPAMDLVGIARGAAARTFSAAYSSSNEKYIDPVSIGNVALEGMRGLGSIDPALTVTRSGPWVSLTSSNRLVAEFAVPEDDTPGAWAALTMDVFAAGRAASAELRRATIETVYEAVFDGALSNLDIYSRYAGTEEARKNRAKREGFGGISIRFRVKADVVRVTRIVPKTPAGRTGLRLHDRIIHVDNVPVGGMRKDQIVDRIRGPLNTPVALTVRRPGAAGTLRFEMEREHIVPVTVFASHRDGIVVLRVTSFNRNTTRSIAAKLKEIGGELGPTMKGVVLDLRGNPGGLLKQSVRIADLFLTQGDIIDTRGRHPSSIQHYTAGGGDLAHGLPMAVLVDGSSASAAEIVAAALQDRNRAVVIGTASFGKGTVQTVIRLPNDGEITLTWSRLVAPSGYVLHGLGVLPGICTSGSAPDDDADPIAAALEHRLETAGALAAWRAAGLGDETRRRELRGACPAERRRDLFDLEVARTLLADRALYGRVLDLMETTAAAEN